MKNKWNGNLEKAHTLTEKPRTKDVIVEDNTEFNDLLLSETTLKGLEACGFIRPSPIQRKAIPLGKCGFDLIIQAKSGTGKTCVFTVTALEMIDVSVKKIQVLILSPTREISVQIRDVISSIGGCLPALKVEAFIGGMPLEKDKRKLQNCQIAVGAPGRVKHLIKTGLMNVNAVRLFVLDEADKLMEESFRQDVSYIYLRLPEIKQMIAASATFPAELEDFVTRYMTNPMRVRPGDDTFLIGIRQFISIVPSHPNVLIQMKNKLAQLLRILSVVSFKQCLVFSNYQSRAQSICNELNKEGWPAIYISGSQNQTTRLKAVSSLKEFRCRVLLTTDLTSRGIDAENVNLIINLDLPYDGATYMHRIGRAGRYGSYGLAISIVQSGEEVDQFLKMLKGIGCSDFQVSLFPNEKVNFDIWKANDGDFQKISSIRTETSYLPNGASTQNQQCSGEASSLEEDVKFLGKLFDCHLTVREKPRIDEYTDLVKISSKFREIDKTSHDFKKDELEEEKQAELNFSCEDYSPELRSFVINLETKHLGAPRKEVELYNKSSKTALKSELESLKLPNDYRGEEIGEEKVCTLQNYKEALEDTYDENDDGGDEDDDDFDYNNDDDDEDEDDDDDDDDFDDDVDVVDDEESGNNDLSENTEELINSESDDCEEQSFRNSFYLKHWYLMWYSQLSTIRHYVNYLKYFHYWNEMHKYR